MKGRERIIVHVKVHPRSRRQKIEEISPGEYKIHVLSPPSKGEANKEVVEILASHFDLPSAQVKIVRGLKSRGKLILIDLNGHKSGREKAGHKS